jgi:hypothetical protein
MFCNQFQKYGIYSGLHWVLLGQGTIIPVGATSCPNPSWDGGKETKEVLQDEVCPGHLVNDEKWEADYDKSRLGQGKPCFAQLWFRCGMLGAGVFRNQFRKCGIHSGLCWVLLGQGTIIPVGATSCRIHDGDGGEETKEVLQHEVRPGRLINNAKWEAHYDKEGQV